jgi:hypothetical protein
VTVVSGVAANCSPEQMVRGGAAMRRGRGLRLRDSRYVDFYCTRLSRLHA